MAVGADKDVCSACKIKVKEDEKGLQCDAFCDKWFHSECVNVDDNSYQMISDLGEQVKWVCKICAEKLETMRTQVVGAEDYTNLHQLVGSLIKLVKEITNDNMQINKRLDIIEDKTTKPSSRTHNVVEENLGLLPSPDVYNDNDILSDVTNPRRNNIEQVVWPCAISTVNSQKPNEDIPSIVEKTSYVDITSRKSQIINKDGEKSNSQETEANGEGEKWNLVKVSKKLRNSRNKAEKLVQKKATKPSTLVGTGYAKHLSQDKEKENSATQSKVNKMSAASKSNIIVGSGNIKGMLVGEKRAWFHLSKVKNDTDIESVENFVSSAFPGISVVVEKLETKGFYASFKIGVDFDRKEEILQSSAWPRNVQIKRLFFRRLSL